MIGQLMALLNPIIPTALAIGGINKINPRLGKFLAYSTSTGYSAESALDFLRSKIQAPGEMAEQKRLQQGEQQGSLRPDERAAQQRMQESNRVPSALGKAATTGIGALAGVAGMGSGNQQPQDQPSQQQEQAQPPAQEEEYNPLASGSVSENKRRSLSPMSQQGNDLIRSAPPTGRGPSPMSQSINEQMRSNGSQQRNFDPLAGFKEFPELMKFIQDETRRGGNAHSIASKARKSVKLGTFVNAVEQKAGEAFESLLARVLGQQQQGQPQQQAQQAQQQNPQSAKLDQLVKAIQAYNQRKG